VSSMTFEIRKSVLIKLVMALGLLTLVGVGSAIWRSWTSMSSRPAATGLLGLSRHDVEARIGAPLSIYNSTMGKPPVFAYCLGGTYKPYYYDHMGHWVEETRAVAVPGGTYGPCLNNPSHPVTILGRYGGDRLLVVGYIGAHGCIAYDLGWQRYVAQSVAGITHLDEGQRFSDLSFHYGGIAVPGAISRYRNGVTLVRLDENDVVIPGAGMGGVVAVLFYAPDAGINPIDEPVVDVMDSLSIEYEGRCTK